MINIIVTMSRNIIIGRDNKLPWGRIEEDIEHFKNTTTGHTVVVGRKTYESVGKPLPDRRNIVLSHKDIKIPGVEVYHSINDILLLDCEDPNDDIFIIGGGWIFRQFLNYAKRIYITKIDKFFDGDTYFPIQKVMSYGDFKDWNIIDNSFINTIDGKYDLQFTTLERIDNNV